MIKKYKINCLYEIGKEENTERFFEYSKYDVGLYMICINFFNKVEELYLKEKEEVGKLAIFFVGCLAFSDSLRVLDGYADYIKEIYKPWYFGKREKRMKENKKIYSSYVYKIKKSIKEQNKRKQETLKLIFGEDITSVIKSFIK